MGRNSFPEQMSSLGWGKRSFLHLPWGAECPPHRPCENTCEDIWVTQNWPGFVNAPALMWENIQIRCLNVGVNCPCTALIATRGRQTWDRAFRDLCFPQAKVGRCWGRASQTSWNIYVWSAEPNPRCLPNPTPQISTRPSAEQGLDLPPLPLVVWVSHLRQMSLYGQSREKAFSRGQLHPFFLGWAKSHHLLTTEGL